MMKAGMDGRWTREEKSLDSMPVPREEGVSGSTKRESDPEVGGISMDLGCGRNA